MTAEVSDTHGLKRALFVWLGLLCVGLGVLGILLPGLPTTPFLLAASYLFAKSSPRLRRWLLAHRWLGPYVQAVRGRRGMPVLAKVATLVLLWITIAASIWLLHTAGYVSAWLIALLVIPAIVVTWFVGWRIRSA